MRSLLLAALGITAFSATMAVETPEANAVVYCPRLFTAPAASPDPA